MSVNPQARIQEFESHVMGREECAGWWLGRLAAPLSRPLNAKLFYAVCVLLLAAGGVAFFGVVHYLLPAGGDFAGTIAFYRKFQVLVKVVLVGIGIGSAVLVALLGVLAAFFWHLDNSKYHVLSWVAMVSDTVFATMMFVAVGLASAPALLYGHAPDYIVHALHVLPFAAIYILGMVWVPNLVATMLIGRRAGLFPTWLIVVGVFGVLGDFLAIFAATTLDGPFNGENGFISFFLPGFLALHR